MKENLTDLGTAIAYLYIVLVFLGAAVYMVFGISLRVHWNNFLSLVGKSLRHIKILLEIPRSKNQEGDSNAS